ncbi:hypothetical protein MBLNU230_g3195t1 [Neophaeotheca triangularis]
MADVKECYLTSVSAGLVLSIQPNSKNVVAQSPGDQDKQQKWIVEQCDQPNVIALRNSGTSEYLHANGGHAGAACVAGKKQWWKVDNSSVRAPHACRLSPVDSPRAFLNHYQGINVQPGHPGMTVHMWPWEPPNEFCLSWYFMDPSGGFGPQSLGQGSVQGANESEEVKAKLKDIEQREATLNERTKAAETKHKELEEREAAGKEKSKAAKAKLKEAEKREAALKKKERDDEARTNAAEAKSKDLAQRESTLEQKENDFEARIKTAEDKSKDLEQREAKFTQRQKDASSDGKPDDSESSKDLEQREATLAQKEKDLDARTRSADAKSKDLEQREATFSQKEKEALSGGKSNKASAEELARRDAALARKEKEVQEKLKTAEARSSDVQKQGDALKHEREDLEERFRSFRERMMAHSQQQQEQAVQAKAAETKLQKVLRREAELEKKEEQLNMRLEARSFGQFQDQNNFSNDSNFTSSSYYYSSSNNQSSFNTHSSMDTANNNSDSHADKTSTPTTKPQLKDAEANTRDEDAAETTKPKANESRQREPSGLTKDDLLRLQLRMLKLEEQLARGPRVVARGDEKNPFVFDCGHKIYPGPRKIRRKLVGYLYE